MNIEKQDETLLRKIIVMKKVTKHEVEELEYILNKYIDNKATICTKCKSQIRFAHKRILNWYEKNKNNIEKYTTPTKGICITVGKELKDKRYKYGNNTCKENK